MTRTYDVAVVGATGAVGETLLALLTERRFPIGRVYALASQRSAGRRVALGDQALEVQDVAQFDFRQVALALFSAGAEVSRQHAPRAAEAGCVVIDNTSQFRYDDTIPLVVPEVNPRALEGFRERNIIANPNCSTIQMVVALTPLHAAVGIERINVATYQAVSGTGRDAMEELRDQTQAVLDGQPTTGGVYPKAIAFNALPHIDTFLDNGYTKEEMKMVWETRKILEDPALQVNATAVRIPVFYGHSEAIHLETRERLSASDARALLENAPGVTVIDRQEPGGYPTAATDGAGHDAVFVGRIREDLSHARGLDLWVVSDNVRKGAALNTLQIAEHLIADYGL